MFPSFKILTIYSTFDCLTTSNHTTPIINGVKMCEHSYINTGMTLQGLFIMRCIKCGERQIYKN